jgi:hypothetical protein
MHVGNYQLKNIAGDTPLYAIASKGMALPVVRHQTIASRSQVRPAHSQTAPFNAFSGITQPDGKSKYIAAILALTLGIFGVHRFYLGKRVLGIINFIAFCIALLVAINEGEPGGIMMAILGIMAFIEATLLFVMPQSEFDAKYNGGMSMTQPVGKEKVKTGKKKSGETPQARKSRGGYLIKDAFIAYRTGSYDQARKYFEDALQYDYNDPQTHFMLACCYSLAKDAKQAYFHLASSVDFGFQEFEEIYHNEALTWLRSQPDFDFFVQNGYRQIAHLTPPKPDLLEEKSYYDTTLLDKIADLGELLERGVISKDDFEVQKKSLLGHE